MDLKTIRDAIATHFTPENIAAFVHGANRVVNALADECAAAAATETPAATDYAVADHDRTAPVGGWLTPEHLREVGREMVENIAAEKWIDGFVLAVKVMAAMAAA